MAGNENNLVAKIITAVNSGSHFSQVLPCFFCTGCLNEVFTADFWVGFVSANLSPASLPRASLGILETRFWSCEFLTAVYWARATHENYWPEPASGLGRKDATEGHAEAKWGWRQQKTAESAGEVAEKWANVAVQWRWRIWVSTTENWKWGVNVWSEGLGLSGEAQSQLAKGCHSQTESGQGLFCRLGVVWALHSLWGQKLCMPWLPDGRKKCGPVTCQLRGSGMKGAISIHAFLGILVAQAFLVSGWGHGGSCDLQVLEKGRRFMQCNLPMRATLTEPGETAGDACERSRCTLLSQHMVHPCSLDHLTVLWSLTWERGWLCPCLGSRSWGTTLEFSAINAGCQSQPAPGNGSRKSPGNSMIWSCHGQPTACTVTKAYSVLDLWWFANLPSLAGQRYFWVHGACLVSGTLEGFPSHSCAQVPFFALQDFSICSLIGQEFPKLDFPVVWKSIILLHISEVVPWGYRSSPCGAGCLAVCTVKGHASPKWRGQSTIQQEKRSKRTCLRSE